MERIIFDNYDTETLYEEARNWLIEEYEEEPDENHIWEEVNFRLGDWYDDIYRELENFFDNYDKLLLFGSVGRWTGRHSGWQVFSSFGDLMTWALKDCDYLKIYEDNGHFYIDCSHHDGSNSFEVRILNERGAEYYDNWNYSWNDKRDNEYIGSRLCTSHYSRLPRYNIG